MAEWTHRCCERCWFDRADPATGRPHGENDDGRYRLPTQMVDPEPGACCCCGGMTVTGIFVRADEKTLPCLGRHDNPAVWSEVGVLE